MTVIQRVASVTIGVLRHIELSGEPAETRRDYTVVNVRCSVIVRHRSKRAEMIRAGAVGDHRPESLKALVRPARISRVMVNAVLVALPYLHASAVNGCTEPVDNSAVNVCELAGRNAVHALNVQ